MPRAKPPVEDQRRNRDQLVARVTIHPVPMMPVGERERAYHDALWKARSDNARLLRLMATAKHKLEGGDTSGAILELDCR